MSLELGLNEVLNQLLNCSKTSITPNQLIQCIDLTLLDETTSPERLKTLNVQAEDNHVAAICVLTEHLHVFDSQSHFQRATVVNFPQGNDVLNHSLKHITDAKKLGATEIDYVLPYQAYLEGFENQVLACCESVSKECTNNKLKLKIIMETGAFPNIQKVYEVSQQLIEIGCDFLKTSTGKIAQGASLAAVFSILRAIKDSNSSCGLKVSGGVKTPQQALHYAQLAELIIEKPISSDWFRIGASSLLDELCKSVTH